MGHLIVKTGVWDREKSKHVSQYGLVCGASIENAFEKLWEIERIIGDDYDLNRLRELVESDQNERCVVLPCKIGDTVYVLSKQSDDFLGDSDIIIKASFRFDMSQKIGKTVFLTRESAEATLKGDLDG